MTEEQWRLAVKQHYDLHSRTLPIEDCAIGVCRYAVREFMKSPFDGERD